MALIRRWEKGVRSNISDLDRQHAQLAAFCIGQADGLLLEFDEAGIAAVPVELGVVETADVDDAGVDCLAQVCEHHIDIADQCGMLSIREQFEMSQKQFADFLMISVRTLQKWEQGQRNPDGAAHALLRVMEREPDAVLRALHE